MPEADGDSGAAVFLQGGGDMGRLLRALDWESSPIGPPARWPQSLRTSVSICLASPLPMAVLWGPELVMLYNDGYRQILGQKHPKALGEPALSVWAEAANILGPALRSVLERGASTS